MELGFRLIFLELCEPHGLIRSRTPRARRPPPVLLLATPPLLLLVTLAVPTSRLISAAARRRPSPRPQLLSMPPLLRRGRPGMVGLPVGTAGAEDPFVIWAALGLVEAAEGVVGIRELVDGIEGSGR